MRNICAVWLCAAVSTVVSGSLFAATVKDIFQAESENQFLLTVEAALARTQAQQGIIPQWAADEISKKAFTRYAPLEEIRAEQSRVNHRMVALLNVWAKSMEDGAGEYVHFGTTTVDIFDTVLVLQLRQAALMLISDMRDIELSMIGLAKKHRNTVMIGRTLGQHALPITFGKKVSVWLGENRRNIERLKEVLARLDQSGILKGAVGSYLGLGDKAMATEAGFVAELGLKAPFLDDWHASRDVLAEYGLVLALISKSYGHIGHELFVLQMTDIGETEEMLKSTAVGSSTMPHKKNPKKPEALIFASRTIPRLAEVIMDDMISFFERDDTSRTANTLADISVATEAMLAQAKSLISQIKVKPEVMRANIDRTRGLIMAQRVTFALAEDIGKTTANSLMHDVSKYAIDNDLTLREAIEKEPRVTKYLSSSDLDQLFDPLTYVGLAAQQVDQVIGQIMLQRSTDPSDH
jgi:adenylosuccinate lyase